LNEVRAQEVKYVTCELAVNRCSHQAKKLLSKQRKIPQALEDFERTTHVSGMIKRGIAKRSEGNADNSTIIARGTLPQFQLKTGKILWLEIY